MPGHPGIRGNERADKLAGTATIGIGRAMGWADILNATRKAGRGKDVRHDCESANLNRLQERPVKLNGRTEGLVRQLEKICKPTQRGCRRSVHTE